jgi:predicted nucleotidyltransferase
MKFGLRDEVIASVIKILRQHDEVEDAIIYGSRAIGNFKPNSDIDITLKGQEISLSTIAIISSKLDDLLLPITFDISAYKTINNPQLIDHINRVGISLYSTNLSAEWEGRC